MKILRISFLILSLFLGNIPFIIMAELMPASAARIFFALGIVVFLVFQVIPMAKKTLQKIPNKVVQSIAKKYNRVFHKLGDTHPDFYAAVEDLTFSRCKTLNEQMPDKDSVYYQSVTSIMKKRSSAGFPLNLVYPIVRKAEGHNDGLVAIESAKWGDFLGVLHCNGIRGISHADMIDLTRENIDGFNVREYYINLVKGLKEKGF